jgi:ubiquinone/menaquinone biosynthesis C-methylase UbiE
MEFANPHEHVLQMGLRRGMRVADLGVGSGRHAISASRIVGEGGRVYAVDIQEDILIRLKDDLLRFGIKNVETVWGDLEKAGSTKLKEHSVDAIILSNVLFQIEHKDRVLTEIKRILKPKGKLLVVDWAGSYGGVGPSEEHVFSEQTAEKMFIDAGFYKTKSFRGGAHHYSILFTAP